jgi:hypothetical protein
MNARSGGRAGTLAFALIVGACNSATATPSPSPSTFIPSLQPSATASHSAEPTQSLTLSPEPISPHPSASPTNLLAPTPTVLASPSATVSVGSWTQPVLIHASDLRPDVTGLAIDAAGHAHVAVRETRDYNTPFWTRAIGYVTNQPGRWRFERVTPFEGFGRAALAVDDDGSTWFAFSLDCHGDVTGCEPFAITVTSNRSGEWLDPDVVADGPFDYPSIAVRNGIPYVEYEFAGHECWIGDGENAHPGPDCGVHLATNSGGDWTNRQLDADGNAASLLVGSDGGLRMAYATTRDVDGTTNEGRVVWAVESADGSFAKEFAPITNRTDGLQLLLDHVGEPVLLTLSRGAWVDTEPEIARLVTRRSGGAWTTNAIDIEFDSVRAVLNGAGRLGILAWNASLFEPDTKTGLWYLDETGDTATATEIAGGAIGSAYASTSADGQVHVVYSNDAGLWYTALVTAP